MLTTIDITGCRSGDETHPDPTASPTAAPAAHERPGPGVESRPAHRGSPDAGRTSAIRLLIVDDHPVVRQGLELLFGTVPGVEVVGLAVDGVQAVDLAIALAPEVVLMDIGMPALDGIEATRRMIAARPELSVVILTGYTDPSRLNRALQAGARRCLFKHGDDREVIDAVVTAGRERR